MVSKSQEEGTCQVDVCLFCELRGLCHHENFGLTWKMNRLDWACLKHLANLNHPKTLLTRDPEGFSRGVHGVQGDPYISHLIWFCFQASLKHCPNCSLFGLLTIGNRCKSAIWIDKETSQGTKEKDLTVKGWTKKKTPCRPQLKGNLTRCLHVFT